MVGWKKGEDIWIDKDLEISHQQRLAEEWNVGVPAFQGRRLHVRTRKRDRDQKPSDDHPPVQAKVAPVKRGLFDDLDDGKESNGEVSEQITNEAAAGSSDHRTREKSESHGKERKPRRPPGRGGIPKPFPF